MGDDVIIDLKAMLLDRKEPPLSTSSCIYRVPHVIRDQNAEAYTPTVVSIGPFHYGNPRLQNLEAYKQKYFQQFIERAQSSTILDELVSFVKNSERRIRACYSEYIKLSENEFVKVMVVDAIFIIELFWKRWKNLSDIVQSIWFLTYIELDLLLFENQLPFFILEKFFNMSFCGQNQGHPSFLQLTFHFFSDYNTQDLEASDLDAPIKHFTDLLRTFYLQRGIEKRERQSSKDARSHHLFYSASELNEAGVRLKANYSKCLLNLKFSGHVLKIPQIFVYDRTEILFRNIIAFEQYHCPLEGHIVYYLSFLDDLINTREDVDVLVHNNIIVNNLDDSNDVAKLFRGLCKNILVDDNHDYRDICKRLNEFYTDPWNKKKATLISDYCRTPWQTAASIAGIFLIILSFVQAICSVLQVAH